MALPIRVYSTSYCAYCVAAKSLLAKRGVAFEEIDVSGDREARDELVEKTGRRTVPQVFINDVPIGGYDELKALDARGELARILAGELPPPSVI